VCEILRLILLHRSFRRTVVVVVVVICYSLVCAAHCCESSPIAGAPDDAHDYHSINHSSNQPAPQVRANSTHSLNTDDTHQSVIVCA
jgi:hypothetical protein